MSEIENSETTTIPYNNGTFTEVQDTLKVSNGQSRSRVKPAKRKNEAPFGTR